MGRTLSVVCLAAALAGGWAASAPVPDRVTAEQLRGLVGKGHFSPEAAAFRRKMGPPPVARYFTPPDVATESFGHEWAGGGVEVQFDADARAKTVFLFAGGLGVHRGYKRYVGELPGGLTFADTSAAVRKKLGPPEDTVTGLAAMGGNPQVDAGWVYPSKGLTIDFDTPDPDDEKATVSVVALYPPTK